mmetsp:Transcript_33062/g.50710  ORF Transcript_33062/g.50710 Transcript_33062/m.50710 type:complete len:151 (-) Transcript_33062:1445-1897(-)
MADGLGDKFFNPTKNSRFYVFSQFHQFFQTQCLGLDLSIPQFKFESGIMQLTSSVIHTKVPPEEQCAHFLKGEDIETIEEHKAELAEVQKEMNTTAQLFFDSLLDDTSTWSKSRKEKWLTMNYWGTSLLDFGSHYFYWKDECLGLGYDLD